MNKCRNGKKSSKLGLKRPISDESDGFPTECSAQRGLPKHRFAQNFNSGALWEAALLANWPCRQVGWLAVTRSVESWHVTASDRRSPSGTEKTKRLRGSERHWHSPLKVRRHVWVMVIAIYLARLFFGAPPFTMCGGAPNPQNPRFPPPGIRQGGPLSASGALTGTSTLGPKTPIVH